MHHAPSGVTLRTATETELQRWNAWVETAPLGTPFHRLEWLRAIEASRADRLTTLVGEREGEIVGVFPLFERRRLGLTLLTSPPSSTLIQALGPLLVRVGTSPLEDERTAMAFFGAAFEHVGGRSARTLVRLKSDLPFGTAREAAWKGLRVAPVYSYVVPIDRPSEEILGSFGRLTRQSIRRAGELGLTVRASDAIEDALRIRRLATARYGEQGIGAPYTEGYLEALWSRVDPRYRVAFCLERDGEFVSGMIAACGTDTLYCLSGVPKLEVERVSVNEFLHVRAMEWARARGLAVYDLVGANTPRLLEFKRKLRPSLREMYTVESDTIAASIARRLYRTLR